MVDNKKIQGSQIRPLNKDGIFLLIGLVQDIRKLIIVLKALTPEGSEGEDYLKQMCKKYHIDYDKLGKD